jgi:hypothetical protein
MNFLVCVKAKKNFRKLCFLSFWLIKLLFEAYFSQKTKIPLIKWPKIYLGEDPDLVKIGPDPQHCCTVSGIRNAHQFGSISIRDVITIRVKESLAFMMSKYP